MGLFDDIKDAAEDAVGDLIGGSEDGGDQIKGIPREAANKKLLEHIPEGIQTLHCDITTQAMLDELKKNIYQKGAPDIQKVVDLIKDFSASKLTSFLAELASGAISGAIGSAGEAVSDLAGSVGLGGLMGGDEGASYEEIEPVCLESLFKEEPCQCNGTMVECGVSSNPNPTIITIQRTRPPMILLPKADAALLRVILNIAEYLRKDNRLDGSEDEVKLTSVWLYLKVKQYMGYFDSSKVPEPGILGRGDSKVDDHYHWFNLEVLDEYMSDKGVSISSLESMISKALKLEGLESEFKDMLSKVSGEKVFPIGKFRGYIKDFQENIENIQNLNLFAEFKMGDVGGVANLDFLTNTDKLMEMTGKIDDLFLKIEEIVPDFEMLTKKLGDEAEFMTDGGEYPVWTKVLVIIADIGLLVALVFILIDKFKNAMDSRSTEKDDDIEMLYWVADLFGNVFTGNESFSDWFTRAPDIPTKSIFMSFLKTWVIELVVTANVKFLDDDEKWQAYFDFKNLFTPPNDDEYKKLKEDSNLGVIGAFMMYGDDGYYDRINAFITYTTYSYILVRRLGDQTTGGHFKGSLFSLLITSAMIFIEECLFHPLLSRPPMWNSFYTKFAGVAFGILLCNLGDSGAAKFLIILLGILLLVTLVFWCIDFGKGKGNMGAWDITTEIFSILFTIWNSFVLIATLVSNPGISTYLPQFSAGKSKAILLSPALGNPALLTSDGKLELYVIAKEDIETKFFTNAFRFAEWSERDKTYNDLGDSNNLTIKTEYVKILEEDKDYKEHGEEGVVIEKSHRMAGKLYEYYKMKGWKKFVKITVPITDITIPDKSKLYNIVSKWPENDIKSEDGNTVDGDIYTLLKELPPAFNDQKEDDDWFGERAKTSKGEKIKYYHPFRVMDKDVLNIAGIGDLHLSTRLDEIGKRLDKTEIDILTCGMCEYSYSCSKLKDKITKNDQSINDVYGKLSPPGSDRQLQLQEYKSLQTIDNCKQLANYCNCNTEVREQLKHFSKNDDADVMFLLGDLVDYCRGYVLGKGNELWDMDKYQADTNWIYFYELMLEVYGEKPIYCVLGNHEYNVNPYQPLTNLFYSVALFNQAHGMNLTRAEVWRLYERNKKVYDLEDKKEKYPNYTAWESVVWYNAVINPLMDFSFKYKDQSFLLLDFNRNGHTDVVEFAIKKHPVEPRAKDMISDAQKGILDFIVSQKESNEYLTVCSHAPFLNAYPNQSYDTMKDGKICKIKDKKVKSVIDINMLDNKHEMHHLTYMSFEKERVHALKLLKDKKINLNFGAHTHRFGVYQWDGSKMKMKKTVNFNKCTVNAGPASDPIVADGPACIVVPSGGPIPIYNHKLMQANDDGQTTEGKLPPGYVQIKFEKSSGKVGFASNEPVKCIDDYKSTPIERRQIVQFDHSDLDRIVGECWLEFQYKSHIENGILPDGVVVEVYDYDPTLGDDLIGTGQMVNGKVHIIMNADSSEKEPDVYFKVKFTKGDKKRRIKTKHQEGDLFRVWDCSKDWSSKEKQTDDGKPGYYDDFDGKKLGSHDKPLKFTIDLSEVGGEAMMHKSVAGYEWF